MKNEGPSAFFKGLTPKVGRTLPGFDPPAVGADVMRCGPSQVLVVGPKLIFAFSMAQSLIPWFGKYV